MKSAFSQVRAVLRNRDRPVPSDLAYRAYLTVMLGIIVLAPLVRGAALGLTELLPVAGDPRAWQMFLCGGLVLLILLPILGWYASPVRIPLPELDLLFTSALPRWHILAGRIIRGSVCSIVVGIAGAGVLLSARMMQGEVLAGIVVPVVLAGAGAGLFGFLLLLLGQAARGTRWQALREQAQRLDTVSALVITGEFRGAAGRLGAPVRFGRSWSWAKRWMEGSHAQPGSAPRGLLLFISRDVIGILRAPLRSIVALIGTAAAGALTAVVLMPFGADSMAVDTRGGIVSSAALGGIVAMLATYASIGPWCRGLRTAGETVGASPVLPYSDSGLLRRHLVVPAVLSTVICAGSSVAATLLVSDASWAHVSFAAIAGVMLSLISLSLRLLGALKGALPQSMLAPVPTPAGDLSGVNVMLWSLDGPIIAAILGAGLFALVAVSPITCLIAALVAVAVVLIWSSVRLRSAHIN